MKTAQCRIGGLGGVENRGRPNRVLIDLKALEENFQRVRDAVGSHARILAVVKSDAYGHGMVPVARTLLGCRIDGLGVAFLHEGIELREAIPGTFPVLLLCGLCSRDEVSAAVDWDLTPVIFDMDMLEVLDQESGRKGRITGFQLKVDTGMGRLGIRPADTAAFLDGVRRMRFLSLQGIISHFSSAGEEDRTFTEKQIACFEDVLNTARSMGYTLPLNNIANSAGMTLYPESISGMVRPGILLYGGGAGQSAFKPVMHFRGQVIQVKRVPAGTPISYGRTYYTPAPATLAVLSAGYADGLPRRLSNRGFVLLQGRRVPMVGTVCMNLTICDASLCGDVRPGDEAVFLGSQGGAVITCDEMAEWAETISYDVFCSIGSRHHREFLE
ncbi:Alanine racemase [uncultured Desulfatiglans sp.]|uniref:Alanine racemase n=1 Tax=Uncultured Desulfatiglans sp. TaxID=1748965 RepID=A0A653AIM2_UNCDX|nr:Alanine racemase [uncultured Desulfatiglans sp.]